MTITEFLLARIAEDEAVAQQVRPDEYLTTRDDSDLGTADVGGYDTVAITSGRVLAECEAKRRIVERFQQARAEDDAETDTERGWVTFGVARALFEDVRDLAAVYADHSDYREEWRP